MDESKIYKISASMLSYFVDIKTHEKDNAMKKIKSFAENKVQGYNSMRKAIEIYLKDKKKELARNYLILYNHTSYKNWSFKDKCLEVLDPTINFIENIKADLIFPYQGSSGKYVFNFYDNNYSNNLLVTLRPYFIYQTNKTKNYVFFIFSKKDSIEQVKSIYSVGKTIFENEPNNVFELYDVRNDELFKKRGIKNTLKKFKKVGLFFCEYLDEQDEKTKEYFTSDAEKEDIDIGDII